MEFPGTRNADDWREVPEACYLPSYDGWIFGKIWGFTTETFSHVLAKFVEILSLHAGLNHATVWSDRNDQILFDCFSRDSQLLGSQVSSTLMATEWSSIALSVALLKNKHQRTYCTKSLNSWITTLHCSFVENVSFFFHTLQPQTFPKCTVSERLLAIPWGEMSLLNLPSSSRWWTSWRTLKRVKVSEILDST